MQHYVLKLLKIFKIHISNNALPFFTIIYILWPTNIYVCKLYVHSGAAVGLFHAIKTLNFNHPA